MQQEIPEMFEALFCCPQSVKTNRRQREGDEKSLSGNVFRNGWKGGDDFIKLLIPEKKRKRELERERKREQKSSQKSENTADCVVTPRVCTEAKK